MKVPIKIKIVRGTGNQPQMVHPDFSYQGVHISKLIDREGTGMNYEVVNTISDGASEMFAMTLLEEEIATAFQQAHPDKVTILNDGHARTFW